MYHLPISCLLFSMIVMCSGQPARQYGSNTIQYPIEGDTTMDNFGQKDWRENIFANIGWSQRHIYFPNMSDDDWQDLLKLDPRWKYFVAGKKNIYILY
ncbi:hypothetical protein QR98_0017540 [Sarcoptes scabiei]|uniref:Uncharacterized protein n=1 Tax=Sarcoptes scabiei TaxID=52283 RepID=A0A131ZXA7_SARSC|nr:hypothetical protein QR98_0017540 [Sarcoptes scabiei]